RVQQLVITGQYAAGSERDVTGQVTLAVGDASIAKLADGAVLLPLANGTTELTATLAGKSVEGPVTVQGMERDRPLNFTNDIVPLFGKLGCSTGACHGASSGQGGFKLSLMGFYPRADYEAIVEQSRGRRVVAGAPELSLLLRKPTGSVGH